MPKIYATEPMMHQGDVYMPGDAIDGDANDIAAILQAGRGTFDQKVSIVAAKQYAAAQAAAANAKTDTPD